jgi:formate hydrogenlyase transcriptional activator
MDHSGNPHEGRVSGRRPSSDRARVLLEINNAIVSHLDLEQVLRAVSDCLRREIKHDFAGLALYNEELKELRLHALDFPNDQAFMQQGQLIPLVGTPAGVAFATRKPVLRHRPDHQEFSSDITRKEYEAGLRSGCAVPLLCHDKIVGSLVVASLRESAFTEDDAELLAQIAAQVAIAVDNAQNFEKARSAQQAAARERDRSRLLLEVNNAVTSHLDLKDLLRSISASLRRIISHDAAFLGLCDPSGTQMQAQALDFQKVEGGAFQEGILIPLDGTPEGKAVASRKPVFVRSLADLEDFPSPWVRYAIEQGIQSGCALPLITNKEVIGVLGIISLKGAALTAEDETLLEQCAGQVTIAVENALNFEKTQRAEIEARHEQNRTRLLLQINNAVVSHLDLSDLIRSISARLSEVISHDSAFISLCAPGGTHLQVQALELGRMRDVVFEEGLLIPMAGTPEEKAIVSRQRVLVRSTTDLMAFSSPWVHYAVEHGVKSGCFLPLVVHGSVLGALGIVSLRENAFSDDDAELLEQCSGQIAIAVENALNFGNARKAEREVRQERDRSNLLLDINNALVSHLDLSELVKTISSSLQHVVHHDSFSLALGDAESGRLFAHAYDSASNPIVEGVDYAPEGTVSGLAFQTGQPVYLPRPDPERFPSLVTKQFVDSGMRCLYSVPVTVHDRKLGVLTFASAKEDAWTAEDQRLLQEIAKQVAIATGNALAVRDLESLKNKLAQEKLYLEDEIRTELNFDEIIGQSSTLREVLKMVETVAPSDSTVLLLGETGTGKELIARAVHEHSRRKSRTFVKLNCAAIPTGLLESELFGHEKGAFTGAIAQKIGRLELADQGTLFLDEVGDIPVEIQPKLLRALQEREFERLGSIHTKKVNVRLVAATNRNLEKMIEERQFRGDLYYRLNVFPIVIPPLRERREDIPLLVRYFAERFSRQMQKPINFIPAETMNRLQQWHWPGNVRELENLIERAVILTTGGALQVPLPEIKPSAVPGAAATAPPGTNGDAEREDIIKVLRDTRGVLAGPNGAAARLGLKRTTLQYKMKKLGITRDHWWPRPN